MKLKTLTLNLSLVLIIGSTAFLGVSCKKEEGCTDSAAENYDGDAEEDDGSCVYAREKFLGSYDVNENCSSGNDNYSSVITTSTTGLDKIVISNFYNFGESILATVNGGNINFNDTKGGVNYSGSGSISGSTLTIIFTASAAGATDNCTATAIKK